MHKLKDLMTQLELVCRDGAQLEGNLVIGVDGSPARVESVVYEKRSNTVRVCLTTTPDRSRFDGIDEEVGDDPYDRGYWDAIMGLGDYEEGEREDDKDEYINGRDQGHRELSEINLDDIHPPRI